MANPAVTYPLTYTATLGDALLTTHEQRTTSS